MSKHKHESGMRWDNAAFSPGSDGLTGSLEPEKENLPENGGLVPSAGNEGEHKGSSEATGTEQPESVREITAVSAELESARQDIASLRSEVAELNEKYLRKLADEVNFRKRMLREKEETQKYAVASLLGDLIPILDDFDRGIAGTESAKSYEQLHEGVILIRKQLSQMLENKYALKRFESKGTPFDPNRHEALSAEPDNVEEPVVSEEYLPGYALHDRILRTAKVRVKMPTPRKATQATTGAHAGQAEVKNPESAENAGQSER